MAQITIDLTDDMLAKLARITQSRRAWSKHPDTHAIKDLIEEAVSDFTCQLVDQNGNVLPDLRNDDSPTVLATNAVLVHAIDNGILEFQMPAAPGSATDAQVESLMPDHVRPWLIRRLQAMTSPKTGSIPIVHNGEFYDIFVEFDKIEDGSSLVRLKIVRK